MGPQLQTCCDMWPFSQTKPSNTALEERIERLERTMKAMVMDWDSTYEKFQRLSARLKQRAKRMDEIDEQEVSPPKAPGPYQGITNPLAIELLRGKQG